MRRPPVRTGLGWKGSKAYVSTVLGMGDVVCDHLRLLADVRTDDSDLPDLGTFWIQNTQNRDSLAIHLKLDELIRAGEKADNEMMMAEHATDEEIEALKEKYRRLYEQVESGLSQSATAPA